MQFRLRTLLIVRSMRFSLRMLLLLVTVVCCVSAYGVNWHRQRDQFLKEQVERSRTMIRANHIPLFAVRGGIPGYTSPLLRIPLRFCGYGIVEIYLSEEDTIGPDKVLVLTTHPDYARAKRLFPEAIIHPVVGNTPSGMIPALRSVNPNELSVEEQKHLRETYLDLMPKPLRKKLLGI